MLVVGIAVFVCYVCVDGCCSLGRWRVVRVGCGLLDVGVRCLLVCVLLFGAGCRCMLCFIGL